MPSAISDRDWDVLLYNLERGSCVALVGPELTAVGDDGQRIDFDAALTHTLAKILKEEKGREMGGSDSLSLVAQVFEAQFSRAELEVEVNKFYSEVNSAFKSGDRSDVLFEKLASLPLPVFVTSRHDRILTHALAAVGKDPVEHFYDFRGDQRLSLGETGTVERPLVYQLQGSLDEPNSLAITESDLLDLLEAIASGTPGLPSDLRNQFNEKSFLFLGCGLFKYYLRVLLHVLGLSKSDQRSYALEAAATGTEDSLFAKKQKESVWFYEVGYKSLTLLDVDEQSFVEQLEGRWSDKHPDGTFEKLVEQSSDRFAERPRVFVSYVSEDQVHAEQLVGALQANGIDPWFDKQELRGGDRWDDALDDAIGKEVDFFVVLLSEHFGDGVETYVHKEVKRALDRAEMRGALPFIFPMMIDENARRLDALDRANIQSEPLGDVSILSMNIKKQYAKLERR